VTRYRWVASQKADDFPVKIACEVAEVSPSAFYEWADKEAAGPSEAEIDEAYLINLIIDIHADTDQTYGSPRMAPELRRRGYCVNHKRVERHMRDNDIVGVTERKKVRTTLPAGGAPPLADLVEFSLIGLRPTSVEDRIEPGHCEGDLIIGAKNASAVVTLVERTSRFNLLGDPPDGHDATSVLACLIELLERIPSSMRRTLTSDQGREMARHHELAGAVHIDVFFAEPHYPWQRRTNENFNGLVRRYVGKGTNLSAYSQQDLDRISLRINTMPRRLHRWDSAQDRYDAAVVALTA
jgi:IS30 family transposase